MLLVGAPTAYDADVCVVFEKTGAGAEWSVSVVAVGHVGVPGVAGGIPISLSWSGHGDGDV